MMNSGVMCYRKCWNDWCIRSFAAKLQVGDVIICSFKTKGDRTIRTWTGIVVKKMGNNLRVKYESQKTTYPFPNNAVLYLKVHVKRNDDFEIRKQIAKYATVGCMAIIKWRWDDEAEGVEHRWFGTVFGVMKDQVLFQYQNRKYTLPCMNAKVKVSSVFFQRVTKVPTVAQHLLLNVKSHKDPVGGDCVEDGLSPINNTLRKENDTEMANNIKAVSFNVRSLGKKTWRVEELDFFLHERNVTVCCLQECRRSEAWTMQHYTVYIVPSIKGQMGMAIVVNKDVEAINFKVHSDRICSIHIPWKSGYFIVLNAYAPHAGKSTTIRESWWAELDVVYRSLQTTKPYVTPVGLFGDFNSNLLKDEMLRHFCSSHNLVISNETFVKKLCQKVTFKGPMNREAILDCFCIDKRWRSSVLDVKAVPNPIPSDHRPLVVKLKWKMKRAKAIQADEYKGRRDWSKLKNVHFEEEVMQTLRQNKLDGLMYLSAMASSYCPMFAISEQHALDLTSTYSEFAAACRSAADLVLVRRPPPEPPPGLTYLNAMIIWSTELCSLTRTQPQFNETYVTPQPCHATLHTADRDSLRRVHDFVKLERSYTDEENREASALIEKFRLLTVRNPHEAWAQLGKLLPRKTTKVQPTKSTPEEVVAFFTKINGTKDTKVPPVYRQRIVANVILEGAWTVRECETALKSIRNHKACGIDEMVGEILRLPFFFDMIHGYCNDYYNGVVPLEVLVTKLALVPKKGDLTVVQNYRGIALISVFLKLIDRLLLNRLRLLDPHLRHQQNGFRPNRGTAEMGLAMKMVADAIGDGLQCCVAFVDFSKAFDSVTFGGVTAALRAFCVPESIIRCVTQCYASHVQKIPSLDASWTVETGVLQGDTLAPFLFVLLLDCILDASIDISLGMPYKYGTVAPSTRSLRLKNQQVNDERYLTDMDYADDLALLVMGGPKNVEKQLRSIEYHAGLVNLKLNVGKNKTEFVNPTDDHTVVQLTDGRKIDEVKKYTYLGHQPFDPEADFKARKGRAWCAIHLFDKLWRNPRASTTMKLSLLNTFAVSIFTFGSAIWPATVAWKRKIDSAYTAMVRYCTWNPDRAKVTDQHTLHGFGAVSLLSSTITANRVKLLGHALRHDQVLSRLATSDFAPPKPRKSKRSSMQQLRIDTWPYTQADWTEEAQNRNSWRKISFLAAERNEDTHWRQWSLARRRRWCEIPRVMRRTDLRILEVVAELQHPPIVSQIIAPYSFPPTTNIWSEQRQFCVL
jgi:hypothetical protein